MHRIRPAAWGTTALALLLLCACQSQPAGGPVVTVAQGKLLGSVEGPVVTFRGIPYAAAPVGSGRWQPPSDAPGWHGVRDARTFAAACPQPARRDRAGGVGETSEDCLYLNVWAPADAREAPVMVWIHGGAFRIGAGSQPYYDGTSFAANGVVLVTLNYRLGRLGFFAHPSLEVSGNFGLMDQAAALEWVQRNVAAFGGDPDNVTVFGESAGGASVLHLLTSAKASGLFARAIIESGGGTQVDRHLTQPRGGRESLMAEGIAWRGADTSAAALRALPVSEVVGDLASGGGIGGVGPVIDADWVTDDPGKLLLAGQFNRVPVLVGANSYEASVLAAFGTDAAAVVSAGGVDRDQLGALYPGDDWAAEAWGDGAFLAGARLIAKGVAGAGLDAYLYHFDYVLARRRGKVPGAGHGTEIPFVFNTLERIPAARLLVTGDDRAMANRLHSHWLSFARSGDPAGRAEGYWPRYTVANDTLLYIGERVEAEAGFRRRQLDLHEALWRRREER